MKISEALWAFAGMDVVYDRYTPHSVYGKKNKEAREFFTSVLDVNAEYDRVESALNFLATHPDKVVGVLDALSRLPQISQLPQQFVRSPDVFIVKKFLVNFARICKALPHTTATDFGVDFRSSELLAFLETSNAQDGDESFYLTEKFSVQLAEVRKEIRSLDASEKSLRTLFIEKIQRETGIDFRFRDFVVLSLDKARALSSVLFVLEPFDSHHFVVRLALPPELMDFAVQREALLVREARAEEKVYACLCEKIAVEFPLLQYYCAAAARLDTALAKARLSQEFGKVRPQFGESAFLSVVEGRFLPLSIRCAAEDLRYWPLTLDIQKRANVVFGSNMGGKTVVLQSLALFQLLAQMGFFVPADSFVSMFFENIFYVGAPSAGITVSQQEGLSGFGQEIGEFQLSWENANAASKNSGLASLILVDEFARTTNSVEASALLGAVLEEFSQSEVAVGVVSTHFMDIKIENGACGFFRMKGLNHHGFAQFCSQRTGDGESLVERIHRVNRFMQYEVLVEKGLAPVRDALAIAEVLGLSPAIIEKAKRHMGEKYGR